MPQTEYWPFRPGAYGLALGAGSGDGCWWNSAPPGWMSWEMEWSRQTATDTCAEHVDDSRARLRLLPAGHADIDRHAASTTLFLPRRPSAPSLAHPYLGSTAVVVARWQGWESFHAGAFALDRRVWGILGDRDQGKSSALAWLSKAGVPIVTDDILVIKDGSALAGPRSLDLRREAAARFAMGRDIGVVGSRRRWRHHLTAVAPELPFAGWIALRWSDARPRIRSAERQERLPALIASLGLRLTPSNHTTWLDLLSRPMFVFERPKDWTVMDDAMKALLDELTLHG